MCRPVLRYSPRYNRENLSTLGYIGARRRYFDKDVGAPYGLYGSFLLSGVNRRSSPPYKYYPSVHTPFNAWNITDRSGSRLS